MVWPIAPPIGVAPFAGAWIEMIATTTKKQRVKSHPSRVRGLKYRWDGHREDGCCRTLRGCVD